MREWLGTAARLLTGGVWLWAGLIKLGDPEQSVLAVRAYQLLPGNAATAVGHLLPPLEVAVGLLLVLGLLTRFAGVVSVGLFAVFIIAIASVWARGLSIDCGCFGGGGYDADASASYPWEIARDAGLLLASAYLVWQGRTRLALDGVLFRSRTDDPHDPHDADDHEIEEAGT